jgi:hypothetical protein
MSEYIHDSLKKALHWGEEGWCVGDKDISVHTRSGAIYKVTSSGSVSGGSRNIKGGALGGAVYRSGGPIRVKQILEGMSMEIYIGNKTLITSTVEKIEFA